MLQLKPHIHTVPDNVWHTFLITLVASFFLWQTGQQLIELFMIEGPVNMLEKQLLDGEGHPLQLWLSSLEMESHPFLWNRIFSFTGWMFTLGLVFSFLKKSSGFVGGLPALILLFVLPGLSLYMCSAGSGSWGAYLFLKAFIKVSGNEIKRDLIIGGIYAGLAVLLAPIWFLPSMGLLAGSWEIFRARFKWLVTGYLGAGLTGGLLFYLLSGSALDYLIVGPAMSIEPDVGSYNFIIRYLFLCAAFALLVIYSFKRRGVGWWSLIFCLPLLFLESMLFSGYGTLLLPFWILTCMGLNKLTVLLDIRFPRAYQSVFLCQLLLWLPVYIGTQPLFLYPVLNF